MPVAEFPGHRGWGYDGIYISAAHSAYGGPHALARLVAAAHELGLAVILDVVYNHVGPSGSQALEAFGPYFTGNTRRPGGRRSTTTTPTATRSANSCPGATGWIRDFGIDGLRLDAIHAIFDSERRAHRGRGGAARPRHARGCGRDRRERAERPAGDAGPRRRRVGLRRGVGRRLPPLAADARHRRPRRLLRRLRPVADLAKSLHRPFVHDGTYSASATGGLARRPTTAPPSGSWSSTRTTTRSEIAPSATGYPPKPARWPRSARCYRRYVPMLFMGEEYGEEAPFQFFSDHIDEDIAQATREGRRAEFASFAAFAGEEIPDPQDRATFERSKLTRDRDPELSALYADLLETRRRLPPGDVDLVEFDEDARWLRVRRGKFELAMNFARRAAPRSPCSGDSVVLATTAADPRRRRPRGTSSRCPER